MPFEALRALAEAVAQPGPALVYRAGGSNEIERRAPLAAALALAAGEGRPFCVLVRPDIVAADFDKPEQAGAVVALAADLRSKGLEPVLVASGQPGRRHLFVRVEAPELRAAVVAAARSAGADIRERSPIRPPLSPHRLGPAATPKLLTPTCPTAAVAALRGPEPFQRSERPRKALSGATQRLLALSPAPGQRSEPAMAAILGLANAGLPEAEAWQELSSAPLGQRYVGPGGRSRFGREWLRAVERVEASPPFRDSTDVRERIDAYLSAAAGDTAWRGLAGSSAWAVLLAHAAIACRRGATSYGASLRELAEAAAVTLPTIRKANQRLRALGLLHLVRQGGIAEGRRLATLWRLTLPNVATFPHSPLTPARGPNGKTSLRSGLTLEGLLRHDVARWGALGKGFPALLLALENAGASRVCVLAAALGRHRVTVSNQLRRLVVLGLVKRSAGKRGLYQLCVEPEAIGARLDRIAFRLGTAGAGLRQQEAHEEQRLFFDAGRPRPAPLPGAVPYPLKPGGPRRSNGGVRRYG